MRAHVLKGSKQDIADGLARITGEVREAIVFVEEPMPMGAVTNGDAADDIFAEMRPYMVDADGIDDSREAIYAPMDGE